MRFSILVTAYNAEAYIGACLDSLLAQTYTDFEVLVIDDGSADSSGRICDGFAERDRRVRVLHTDNQGVLCARALAEEKAAGEYLLHVDGDDLVMPDMLGAFSEAIDRAHPDLICCDFSYFHADDAPVQESFFPRSRDFNGLGKEELYRLLLSTRFNSLCNKCFSRTLRSAAPDYMRLRGLRHGEDLLRAAYLVTSASSVVYLPQSFYLYRRDVGHSGRFERDSLRGSQTVAQTVRRLLQSRVQWDDGWETLYRDMCRKQLDNYLGLLFRSKTSFPESVRILRESSELPLVRDALACPADALKYRLLRQRMYGALLLLGRGKGRFNA